MSIPLKTSVAPRTILIVLIFHFSQAVPCVAQPTPRSARTKEIPGPRQWTNARGRASQAMLSRYSRRRSLRACGARLGFGQRCNCRSNVKSLRELNKTLLNINSSTQTDSNITKHNRAATPRSQRTVVLCCSVYQPLPIRYIPVTTCSIRIRGTVTGFTKCSILARPIAVG